MADITRKPEFVEKVAAKLGVTKKDAEPHVDAFIEALQDELVDGRNVQFLGFGTFEVRERKARKGRNPKTGEEIEVAASKVPAFKPGNTLKDVLNGKAAPKAKVASKTAEKADKSSKPSGKKKNKNKKK